MASYVVMEHPEQRSGSSEPRAVFVRDGFAFLAFLLPFVWFLWHRMWIEAAAALAVAFALAGLGTVPGMAGVTPVLSILASILFGLEAQALRIACLSRRGWRMWGAVEAANRDDAETRYIAEIADEPARGAVAPEERPVPSAFARPAAPGPALGLFDYPGGR